MSIFDILKKKEPPKKEKRSFVGAIPTRYTDWINATLTKINSDLVNQQPILLSKCRDLAKNNPIVRSYLGMAQKNIIGKTGLVLQSQMKTENGDLDEDFNDRLEWAWYDFGKAANGYLTIDGGMGHNDFDALILRTLLIDGEVFIRIHKNADNPYGLSFELIDTAAIDFTKKRLGLPNQHPIINGVELDEHYRPIYYYVKEGTVICYEAGRLEKIPASEMIHLYKREFPQQTRGIPPFNAVLNDLKQLEDFKVAELMAAKASACLSLFYERNTMASNGDFLSQGEEGEKGEFVQALEPGMASVAPTGYNVKSITPAHPNNGFGEFNKAVLQQIASSLGVSYNKLCKDYSSVNYSSLREGTLDEQAYFSEQQSFLIDQWKEVELKLFLESIALHTDIVKPSQTKDIMKFHTWITTKRSYFDKSKDLISDERSVALGIKSPIELIEENGGDPDEVLKNFKLWQKLCEKYGLNFKTNNESELPPPSPDDDTQ